MNDEPVSRQAAIEASHAALYDFFGLCKKDFDFPITNTDYLVWAIRKNLTANINALPAAQRWIPVTERLPKEGQVVVVQYNDGDYDMLKFPTAYRRCDIVAWMPIPEPWKGESDGLER